MRDKMPKKGGRWWFSWRGRSSTIREVSLHTLSAVGLWRLLRDTQAPAAALTLPVKFPHLWKEKPSTGSFNIKKKKKIDLFLLPVQSSPTGQVPGSPACRAPTGLAQPWILGAFWCLPSGPLQPGLPHSLLWLPPLGTLDSALSLDAAWQLILAPGTAPFLYPSRCPTVHLPNGQGDVSPGSFKHYQTLSFFALLGLNLGPLHQPGYC